MSDIDSETASAEREYPALFLRKNEERRLRSGHLWIYSNEVDTDRSPLHEFNAGEIAIVCDHRDAVMGFAYVNPNALICARLLSRDIKHAIDKSLLVHRLNVALSLRERMFALPYYRAVYGESDGLPGLVLDRFHDVIVGQIATVGMEQLRAEIEAAVAKVFKPRAFIWKNSGSVRAMENQAEYVQAAIGESLDKVETIEGGCRFEIDPVNGQKTGWFFDQSRNRDVLTQMCTGKRVLDVFAYVGAWGVRAAHAGAREVVCVDTSKRACEAITRNAALNQVTDRVTAIEADAFDALKSMRANKEQFDIVIVDPPAFIKRRKDFNEGLLAYRRIFEMAMQLLGKDGILFACSCSHHLSKQNLHDVVYQAARHLDRQAQIIVQLQQAPDHPIHPAIAETEYLKGLVVRVFHTN